jgi:hypothetical protein
MTGGNDMDVLAILEQIEGLISNSSRVPLTDKVIISENEVLRLIDELHAALPTSWNRPIGLCGNGIK